MSGVLLQQDPQAKEVLKTAWGDWLTTNWDWDWWVTLTFDPVTQDRGGRFVPGSATHTQVGWQRSSASWDAWLNEIEGGPGLDGLNSLYWFRGREPNPNRRGTHFHALVGGVPAATRRDAAWRRWFDRHGLARIEAYDRARGAGWYVAKYVVKELGDLRFSDNAGNFRTDRPAASGAVQSVDWGQSDSGRHVPPW
jgi:hypothetical protein